MGKEMDYVTRTRLGMKYRPHPEYRFWLYCPENGMTYFSTKEARDEAAALVIDEYLDDGWDEAVEQVAAGEVTHCAQMIDKKVRPADLDEEGCDGEGTYWGDFEYMGTYTLETLTPNSVVRTSDVPHP